MKHKKTLSLALVISISVFIIGCSSDGGSGPGDASELVGTWSASVSKPITDHSGTVIGTEVSSIEFILREDGTFEMYETETETYPSNPASNEADYDATKGTYSAEDGILAITPEYFADSDSPFQGVIDWQPENGYVARPYAIINDKLCYGVMARQGTGTNVSGDWTIQSTIIDEDDFDGDGNATERINVKTTYLINTATESLMGGEAFYNGTTWTTFDTWTADITIVDPNTARITYEEGNVEESEFIVTDRYLLVNSDYYAMTRQ